MAINRKLQIRHKDTVAVDELKIIRSIKRPRAFLSRMQIDLLAFIPVEDDRMNVYAVDDYRTPRGESRLRVWCYHKRGSSREIDVRRYVDVLQFGELLGQYQAEGDKESRHRVAFTNKLLSEHVAFLSNLGALGIARDRVSACVVYNPDKLDNHSLQVSLRRYSARTGLKEILVKPEQTMKGSLSFVTIVRSTILKQIVDKALADIRRTLTSSRLQPGHVQLLKRFVGKLLTGDGTLDVSIRPTRVHVTLKIVDRVRSFRRDYSAVLLRLGFRPKISHKRLEVKSYCTFRNLLTLYEIGAFHGTLNWVKLLCAVALSLRGAINKGYERLVQLSPARSFTCLDVSGAFRIGTRSANLWIHSMMKRGLIGQISTFHGHSYITYEITDLGLSQVRMLRGIRSEFERISQSLRETNPHKLLQKIKVKGRTGESGDLRALSALGSE